MAAEDSEDTHSRADSKTDSRTDLQIDVESTAMLGSSSMQSVSSENNEEPWRSQVTDTPPTTPKSPTHKMHKFLFKNFNIPIKCSYCTSLLIGVQRQGISCAG